MSYKVGNQNFGFLMTRLKCVCSYMYVAYCDSVHDVETASGLCLLQTASGNRVRNLSVARKFAVFQHHSYFLQDFRILLAVNKGEIQTSETQKEKK